MTANGAQPSVPVVDFAQYNTGTLSVRTRIADALVKACIEYGFVYITGHGVPQDDLNRAFEISKHFFASPLNDKMKAPHPPGWTVHRGYSWPGLEKVSNATASGDDYTSIQAIAAKLREVQDTKESFEIGSEADPDMPNIWPPSDIYPAFRPFMASFYWTMFEAAKPIIRALALGIGLSDENHLLNFFSGDYNQLRLLHYPPIDAKYLEDGSKARMPAHSDWSAITLLFQDETGGLQVESPGRPGHFIDVEPLEGGMLLNIGDLMMRWSDDYLKSTPHRVTLPPLQNRTNVDKVEETGKERMTRARYSIPYFLTTDPDLVIESLRTQNEKPKYEPITRKEYYALRARMQY